jgi:phenylpropionate dioxygenase-like ring-hydroxylating dioxygenase large terminal subunit
MQALLSPFHYTNQEYFLRERTLLTEKVWNFVGCLNDLSEPNAFITAHVGGKPIVIQRAQNGELGAFSNVCRHRYSLIQGEKFGIRSLTCPYHGWAYDSSGVLQGIPCRQSFPELTTKAQAKEIKLPKYNLATCGNLVFVSSKSLKQSLQEYLGPCFDRLDKMTSAFGRRIDRNEMIIEANWKIVVENTLEAYHVSKVHEHSFHKLGLNTLTHTFQGSHSTMAAHLESASQKDFERISRHFMDRPETLDGYFHQMLFPCMTLATTGGLSFAIQEIEPLSASQTRFTSHVFFTTYEGKQSKALENALATTIIAFNRKVFDEDKMICESVYKGASASEFPAILGENEDRIAKFQAAYLELIGKL